MLEPFESALDEIVRERRALDAAEAAWLAKVAEYTRSGVWQTDGYVNAAAALRDRCRMTAKSASAAVHLARKLGRLPALAAAFGAGQISREHATAVTRAYTRDREVELDGMDGAFAEYAVLVNPGELRDKVKLITDAIDTDGGAADDETIYQRRRLDSSPVLGAIVGDWYLDREGGDIVNTAIAAQVATANVDGDTAHRQTAARGCLGRYLPAVARVGPSPRPCPQTPPGDPQRVAGRRHPDVRVRAPRPRRRDPRRHPHRRGPVARDDRTARV